MRGVAWNRFGMDIELYTFVHKKEFWKLELVTQDRSVQTTSKFIDIKRREARGLFSTDVILSAK